MRNKMNNKNNCNCIKSGIATILYSVITGLILYLIFYNNDKYINIYIFVIALIMVVTLSIAYILSLLILYRQSIEEAKNKRLDLYKPASSVPEEGQKSQDQKK